jgi:UDP-glucose 4-epimerase
LRILITGVAGFIGSNLAHRLLASGYEVIGIDNMSQGDPLNLDAFRNHPLFEMHQIDIRHGTAVLEVAEGCSTIVHLAAYKIPRYSDALDTLLINSLGSENIVKSSQT